jgi:4-hydroxy-3-methylbut-2-enyl diphosphate reductase
LIGKQKTDTGEVVVKPESVEYSAVKTDKAQQQGRSVLSEEDGHLEEVSADAPQAPESFEEMLEKSIKTLHTGQKVTGIVTSITATEVSVDLGTKQSGYIPLSEFTDDLNTQIEDIIKIGDSIESFVMRVNDVECMVRLSKKRLDAIKNWDVIEAAKENRSIVEGFVTEENKGGVVVNVKGVRVFVPASQTGLPKSSPMSELVRKPVKLRITEVNQSRRRVVGSIRAVQADERREKSDRVWNNIEKGKAYNGTVKSMTSYGVFVDIGGVDGMIHISELSWTRIKQPSEVMAVGDEVSVYVLSFDKENRKISLGFKKSEDNPWARFTSQHSVGDVVNVKIVKMMPFGAFAEICPGVDGLIHISQITDHRIGLPSEVLTDGQKVDVKITEIDYDRKKVSLSIRALIDPASQPVTEKDAAEAVLADKTPVILYDTDSPPEIIEEE